MGARPTLIGRATELDLLVAAMQATESAAVVIAGPAGVGKSRLAAELAGTLASPLHETAQIICTESAAAIPFGAFASLIPDLQSSAGGLLGLLQQASERIRERGEGAPLLLLVDDAHLLDDGSAALVHQLAQSRSCALVLTVRTPEVAPDPITSLWKDGLAMRIDLKPLARRDVEKLLVGELGGAVAGSALHWFWETTRGNPLFVRELLVGARDSDSLYQHEGVWFVRLPLPAPQRLTDLVSARLAGVAPKTVDLVDLLALGEPLELEQLEMSAGHEALEDAEHRGLIKVEEEEGRLQIRLSHPVYGDILRPRIPRARRRRLCLTLAEGLESGGSRGREDPLRVARWRMEAGARDRPDLFEQAARLARGMFDLPLASRLARAALDAGGGATAGLVLGETEFMVGHHEEAERVLASVVPLCRTDEERALIANARAYNLGVLQGDEAAASQVVETALDTITAADARLRLVARQAVTDVYSGRLAAALSRYKELEQGADPIASQRGTYVGSLALALSGHTEPAVDVAYRGFDLHSRSMERNQGAEAQLVGAIVAHVIGGRLEAAERDADKAYGCSVQSGDREGQATFGLLQGWVLLERGMLGAAADKFREGVAINREVKDLATLRWCLGGLATAEGMAGNAEGAEKAETELGALPPHWMIALEPFLVARASAWCRAARGELSAARVLLWQAAERAGNGEELPAEAFLLHELARFGEARTVETRLGQLADRIDGDLAQTFAEHASALVTRDPDALEGVARRFEQIGALLLAAEAAAASASAYEAAGRTRQATGLRAESRRLRDICGATRTPLLATNPVATRLTRREREIGVLASSGLSSRAIAERLYLSVRTVDNHLQHVYTKLGVTSRDGLRSAFQDLD